MKLGALGNVFWANFFTPSKGALTTAEVPEATLSAMFLVADATIDESPIPNNIATTWVSTVFTSTSSSANSIKNGLGAKVNELTFS